MAFDRTKPADTDYISASAANLRENFRALAEDTRLYGTGFPESSAGQNGWRYVDTATGDEYLKVNNAWIKKTDLADLIRGLFLGTVSEDGGIPTGAIMESGSNSNGYYIKLADGTMMTYRSMGLTFTGAVITSGAENIAALYKDMNFIVSATSRSTVTESGAYCAVFKANPYTEGSVVVEAADLQNMARTGIITVNITTIGRWF